MEHLKLEEKLWLETHESADDAVTAVENNSATLPEAIIPKIKKLFDINVVKTSNST